MKSGIYIAAAFCFVGSASSVWAQSCAGVEARVNVRTSELSSTLMAQITARTSAVVAQETLQRNQLMSAVRVMTRQSALSAEQEVNASNAAQMALSNVIVEDSVARQVHDAVTAYGNTGHGACELVEAGASVATMMDNYSTVRETMAVTISERRNARNDEEFRQQMAEWSNLVSEADDATVQSLLSGDPEAAQSFIAVVAGPPRYPAEGETGSVLSQMDRVQSLRNEARSSAAVYALADIAAGQGLREAMTEMSAIWTGDGGEQWAARMAASPERAVLLDTARIEAHNIATSAMELRQGVTQEFALSAFALTYIDNLRDMQSEGDE